MFGLLPKVAIWFKTVGQTPENCTSRSSFQAALCPCTTLFIVLPGKKGGSRLQGGGEQMQSKLAG